MDFLKAEIERKRKLLESSGIVNDKKKFFRRSELDDVDVDENADECNANDEVVEKVEDPVDDGSVPSSSSTPPAEESERQIEYIDSETDLPASQISDIYRKLRERNEPVRIFAESDHDVFRRLRKLEVEAPELSKGWKNDLQEAMEKDNEEYIKEILANAYEVKKKLNIEVEDDGTTLKSLAEMVEKSLGKGDSNRDCEIILSYIRYILKKWAFDLNNQPEDSKRSPRGKMARARYIQTQDYLKPLLRKLEKHGVASDILEHLINILHNVIAGEYIHANNAYMEMAIGNAPWPCGVTASGIHKRPGNEKFYVKNIAHVLNDETQRKYIQAFKRVITKTQEMFPSAPSKCVDFTRD